MAAIGKIREHGVLLICIIGFAMLAFILTSSIDDMSGLFRGNQTRVGKIEGVNVDIMTYEKQVENLTSIYKMSNPDLSEDATQNIRNEVWQTLVNDYTMQAQANKIGMKVTQDELSELCFGAKADQMIINNFGSGANALMNYNYAYNEEIEDEAVRAQVEQFKTYWEYLENNVRINRLQKKYIDLLSACVTANSLDAKFAFEAGKKSVNVDFVMKPYYAVADDAVEVKNSDITKLYNKQKEMYRLMKPIRSVDYVEFMLTPSEKDIQDTKGKVEALMEEFASAEDVTTVTNLNSDVMYEGVNYSETTIPAEWKEFAFAKDAKAGNVSELIFANNMYQVARIVEAGYSLPDSIQLTVVDKEEGQEDQVVGWFQESMLTKEMAEKAFACKKGEKFTMGKGEQAQDFIVSDLSAATPKVKMAILARELFVSDRTKTFTLNEAMQFIINNPTVEAIKEAADSLGLLVRHSGSLTDVTFKVDNLKSSRDIVKWAFSAKEGDVSDEAYLCDDRYVVVALTDVNDGEYLAADNVQVAGALRLEATNDKKAELIKGELAGIKTLEEAAEKCDAEIQHAENITFASDRLGNFNEAAVIGAATQLAAGQISEPIKGENGVFVISVSEPVVAEAEFNKDAQIQMLNMYNSYMLPRQAMMLLQREAKVEDNRAKFF